MTFSTLPETFVGNNADLHQVSSHNGSPPQTISSDKAKARAILAAIRTLHTVEQAQRPATPEERAVLARFPGFGPVALGIFPDPVTGRYKDATWQQLGEELRTRLTPEDYASAKRTTFTAFYTSPLVIRAMHAALVHLGVPPEADAALHRLHVLQKHHADEQFLARRQLRALPADITRLERRVSSLTQDMATAEAHAADPVTIGTRSSNRHDALEALAARLPALPALVYETHTVALGLTRGLRFGLVQHPQGAPEVYVEGTLRRSTALARDVHGPRAILNAVERLIGSAAAERDKARRDLEIAQGQLRDYEARLGAGFPHATYLEALTGLRTQLEAALSSTTHEEAEGALPTVGDLVERLKALHAAHTVEASPERSAPRRTATVEEAITTRIRQREQAETAPQSDEEPSPVVPATPAPPPVITPPPATPAQARPAPWQPPQQLRLF